jgi:hypothetical protein
MSTPGGHSIIFLIAAIAGAIVMISTMCLIGLRRIYVDRETNTPTEFEFPLLGKMKTQSPALFLVAAGFMLTGYAVYQEAGLRKDSLTAVTPGTLEGEIDLNGASATVLVLSLPGQYQNPRETSGPFKIQVPLIPGADYQVKYEVDQHIFPVQADFSNGTIKTVPFKYTPPQRLDVQAIKDVSDEELKHLALPN